MDTLAPTHITKPPFKHSIGPKNAKIAIVGEAHGRNEAMLGVPFCGWSGLELARLLFETGIVSESPAACMDGSYVNSTALWYYWERQNVFLTNVFAFQPGESNKIDTLCAKRVDVGKDYPMPHWAQGKYIRPEYLPEVDRLAEELSVVKPNLVIAMGNTATWALLRATAINSIRGAIAPGQGAFAPHKILPTLHPANVLYQWQSRVIIKADLIKAKLEAEFPDIRRPQRWVLVSPTLKEIEDWIQETLRLPEQIVLGIDTETRNGQIEMVSFASSPSRAINIPFMLPNYGSYWPTAEEEVAAWNFVKLMLHSDIPKVFQNGMYDTQYFWRMGLTVNNCQHDTMLLAHSMYPELQKGLGFLGSIFTSEVAWKLMNSKNAKEAFKADE